MRWPLTFYTNIGIPEGFAACARGPVILIRPQYRGDYGLYRHELTHIKQAFVGLLLLHAMAYRFISDYRLHCEVEAYREQARHYADDRIPMFAGMIAEKYSLGISAIEAERRLRA